MNVESHMRCCLDRLHEIGGPVVQNTRTGAVLSKIANEARSITTLDSILSLRPLERRVGGVANGITFSAIVRAGADRFGVSVADIISARRARDIADLRFAISFVGRMLTLLSYPQMARVMRRDHTSILHGVQMVSALPTRYLPIVNAILDHIGYPRMSATDLANAHRTVRERIAA
ncbi:MAG TPA: helix-turn-helix domain-containing protein [Aestuariivirga sp.]|nr:helix-turn-helix domain-containing protein [Aestuariivirga sp.]